MVGTTGVGKTSLVSRFVQSIFSEKYLMTVGVRIEKKLVDTGLGVVSMVIWDLAGDDEFQRIQTSYFRGSAGYLLVADGLRRETLQRAVELQSQITTVLGEVPFSLLINKADLRSLWEVTSADLDGLRTKGWNWLETSAKESLGVEEAFHSLAMRLVV